MQTTLRLVFVSLTIVTNRHRQMANAASLSEQQETQVILTTSRIAMHTNPANVYNTKTLNLNDVKFTQLYRYVNLQFL